MIQEGLQDLVPVSRAAAIRLHEHALEKLRVEMDGMRDLLSRKQDEIARLRGELERARKPTGPWPGDPGHRETIAYAPDGVLDPLPGILERFELEEPEVAPSPDLPHAFQGPAASGRCSYCEKALEHPIHESRAPECR